MRLLLQTQLRRLEVMSPRLAGGIRKLKDFWLIGMIVIHRFFVTDPLRLLQVT